jgi:hypothetical protein
MERKTLEEVKRTAGQEISPRELRRILTGAYRAGLAGAFAAGACISALSLSVVLFLPERPLRAASRALH